MKPIYKQIEKDEAEIGIIEMECVELVKDLKKPIFETDPTDIDELLRRNGKKIQKLKNKIEARKEIAEGLEEMKSKARTILETAILNELLGVPTGGTGEMA